MNVLLYLFSSVDDITGYAFFFHTELSALMDRHIQIHPASVDKNKNIISQQTPKLLWQSFILSTQPGSFSIERDKIEL